MVTTTISTTLIFVISSSPAGTSWPHAQGREAVRPAIRRGLLYAISVCMAPRCCPGCRLTLAAAFQSAHGVFLVTNFWETGADERKQATAAVRAAQDFGTTHSGLN
jgi:hypothetical protein